MTDQKTPLHVGLLSIGRHAKITNGKFTGETGVVTGYTYEGYHIKLETGETVAAKHPDVLFLPKSEPVVTTPNHVGSLTSAGVAEELVKPAPEPLSEREQLRQEVQRLTNKLTAAEVASKKADKLFEQLQAAEAARDSHLAANVKLNEEKIALETERDNHQRDLMAISQMLDEATIEHSGYSRDHGAVERVKMLIQRERECQYSMRDMAGERNQLQRELNEAKSQRNTDIEALKLVERDRDEAREELRKSEKIVQMFAKRLRAKKAQPVEVKTLVQHLTKDLKGESAGNISNNTALADLLSDGWTVLNMSASSFFDDSNRDYATVRTVTLSRPVKRTPQPPKRETAVEEPVPAHAQTIFGAGISVPAGTSYSGVTLNENATIINDDGSTRPVTFDEAMQLHREGQLTMEEVKQIGNRQMVNLVRAGMMAHQPVRPISTRFQLTTKVGSYVGQ